MTSGNKIKPVFVCEKCSFETKKRNAYEIHCLTRKHLNTDTVEIKMQSCPCGKSYKHRQSLHTHKLKCTTSDISYSSIQNESEHATLNELPNAVHKLTCSVIEDETISQNKIVAIIESHEKIQMMTMTMLQNMQEENSILHKQLATLCNTVNINSNCNNKTFNLQVFLNEDCKDAMNMSDFINSVQLQLSDLESVGELGYVDGISNIFLQKLNELDMYKRPIHCTDVKRHVIHIKDADEWTRDDNHTQFKHAIKRLSKKNSDLLMDWKERHPGSQDAYHRQNGQFLNMIIQSMGGPSNTSIDDSECKIIKRVSKGITVEKSIY